MSLLAACGVGAPPARDGGVDGAVNPPDARADASAQPDAGTPTCASRCATLSECPGAASVAFDDQAECEEDYEAIRAGARGTDHPETYRAALGLCRFYEETDQRDFSACALYLACLGDDDGVTSFSSFGVGDSASVGLETSSGLVGYNGNGLVLVGTKGDGAPGNLTVLIDTREGVAGLSLDDLGEFEGPGTVDLADHPLTFVDSSGRTYDSSVGVIEVLEWSLQGGVELTVAADEVVAEEVAGVESLAAAVRDTLQSAE